MRVNALFNLVIPWFLMHESPLCVDLVRIFIVCSVFWCCLGLFAKSGLGDIFGVRLSFVGVQTLGFCEAPTAYIADCEIGVRQATVWLCQPPAPANSPLRVEFLGGPIVFEKRVRRGQGRWLVGLKGVRL